MGYVIRNPLILFATLNIQSLNKIKLDLEDLKVLSGCLTKTCKRITLHHNPNSR